MIWNKKTFCLIWKTLNIQHPTQPPTWITVTIKILRLVILLSERDSLTVSAFAWHAADPGLNPGEGKTN